MKKTTLTLACLALLVAGCSDKDDTTMGEAMEPESAVVVEEAEIVTEPASGTMMEEEAGMATESTEGAMSETGAGAEESSMESEGESGTE